MARQAPPSSSREAFGLAADSRARRLPARLARCRPPGHPSTVVSGSSAGRRGRSRGHPPAAHGGGRVRDASRDRRLSASASASVRKHARRRWVPAGLSAITHADQTARPPRPAADDGRRAGLARSRPAAFARSASASLAKARERRLSGRRRESGERGARTGPLRGSWGAAAGRPSTALGVTLSLPKGRRGRPRSPFTTGLRCFGSCPGGRHAGARTGMRIDACRAPSTRRRRRAAAGHRGRPRSLALDSAEPGASAGGIRVSQSACFRAPPGESEPAAPDSCIRPTALLACSLAQASPDARRPGPKPDVRPSTTRCTTLLICRRAKT